MVETQTHTRREVLEERLARGADFLFDMEQRGDTGGDYTRWLAGWRELLDEYERMLSAA